jgi:hypothetical protein
VRKRYPRRLQGMSGMVDNMSEMESRRSGLAVALIAACGLAAIAVPIWWFVGHNNGRVPHRRVRIGVDQAAPYQSWSPGRGPVGFSVDVLSEAALRGNIELQWEFRPEVPGRHSRNTR